MKCTVITGTAFDGTTRKIEEIFLKALGTCEVSTFTLPKDGPDFCTGCKNCFTKGEEYCPHKEKVMPIWEAMKKSDAIIFIYPVYVMRAPAQIKSLLDHLAVFWMAHRPAAEMFKKRAAVITQSIGASNRFAQRDVKTSMEWWGISKIDTLGFRLMESDKWDELSEGRKDKIAKKIKKFARKIATENSPEKKNLKTHFLFNLCKKMQKSAYEKLAQGEAPSRDLKYWIDSKFI